MWWSTWFQHASSAVVLATQKVFLPMPMSTADVHQQVYERVKDPLLTLVSSGSPEQSYAVLAHLHPLVMRAPMLFSSDYMHFYWRDSDPFYVKMLKLEMLTAVATDANPYDIVTELSQYTANVDVAIARESTRAVGKIALQQYDVSATVDRLFQFLEMEKDYVTADTLVLIKDLLRKHLQWSHDCAAVVGNVSSKSVQESKAKAALVWMLGEYAYDMEHAPYVLEDFVKSWAEEDCPEVRLELLVAAMNMFFERPPEAQKLLGATLSAGLADPHQDVHDRALLYYRLLHQGVEIAERAVNPQKQPVSVFADRQTREIKDRIFDEFNSLSVVYREPSYMFLDKELCGALGFSEDIGPIAVGPASSEGELPTRRVHASDDDLLLNAAEKEEEARVVNNGSYEFFPLDPFTPAPRFASPSPPVAPSAIRPSAAPPNTSPTSGSTVPSLVDLLGLCDLTLSSVPSAPQFKLESLSLPPQAATLLTGPQPLLHHMQARSFNPNDLNCTYVQVFLCPSRLWVRFSRVTGFVDFK